jgi:hypothetical protein
LRTLTGMPAQPKPSPPPRSRWSSFVAEAEAAPGGPGEPLAARARILHEEGNPNHRLRVEHNRNTILVHLSEEDGHGWLVLAVDRASRRWAVATARRQLEAAKQAFEELYDADDASSE